MKQFSFLHILSLIAAACAAADSFRLFRAIDTNHAGTVSWQQLAMGDGSWAPSRRAEGGGLALRLGAKGQLGN